jgi:hypothetical protein
LGKIFNCVLMVGVALTLVLHEWGEANQKGQIIAISPRVGETIDREERDRYGLFQASVNFQSAVILQQPDGNYVAEITEERNGEKEIRMLSIDRRTLDQLRDFIENFKESRRPPRRPPPAPQTRTPGKRRRWAILFGYGHRQGNGRGNDVKGGLIRGGLDYAPYGLLGRSSKPFGRAEHGATTIMVRYALNRRFGLCMLRSTGDYFRAAGLYHEGSMWDPSAGLDLEGHLTTYALLVEFYPRPFLRLGVGPAYHSLKVKSFGGELGNDPGPTDNPKSQGPVIEMGLSLPSRSRIFVELSVQHHLAGAVTIGPFDATYDNGDAPATMPPTSVSIGHTKYVLGLGVRL